jgi:hypothetical protein
MFVSHLSLQTLFYFNVVCNDLERTTGSGERLLARAEGPDYDGVNGAPQLPALLAPYTTGLSILPSLSD